MSGVRAEVLAARFPRLFHMAEAGSWPSIQRHGLLSTSALIDLFEVKGARREALEARHRPESVTLTHPRYGTALVPAAQCPGLLLARPQNQYAQDQQLVKPIRNKKTQKITVGMWRDPRRSNSCWIRGSIPR